MDKRSKEYRELHPRQPKAENPSAREPAQGIGTPEPVQVRPTTKQEATQLTPTNRETTAHGNEGRPERVSIGAKQEKLARLAAPYMKGEGTTWHHVFVEDDDKGNVDSYKMAYYEFVTDAQGNQISYPSGAFRLVLMKILMEYFTEDQALLEKESSDMLMTKIELNRQAGEYSPGDNGSADGGKSALSRNEGVFDPTL